jgi:hypothetical protein
MPDIPPRAKQVDNETAVLRRIRAAIAVDGRGLVWRNNVGALRDENGRVIRYGLAIGSADLISCQHAWLHCPACSTALPPIGRFVAVEVKSQTGRMSTEQTSWQGAVRGAGGVTGIARTEEEAMEIVEQAHRWPS